MVACGVARGHRYDGHADSLGAVVEAEPTREEAVTEGDVQQVAAACAGGRQGARHDLAPDVEVPGGIGGDGRLAFGAGGGVDSGDLSAGHRQEAERILVPEVRLADEREAREVRERDDRGGAQTLSVKRNVLDGPAERILEALELQALADRPRHGLRLGIPDQLDHSSAARTADSRVTPPTAPTPTVAAVPRCAEAAPGTAGRPSCDAGAPALRAGSGGPDGRGWRGPARSRTRREAVPALRDPRRRRAAGH